MLAGRVPGTPRLGLVIRSAPWVGRSGREQLDVALAAASLGVELVLVFTGAGRLQLLAGMQPRAAHLPVGLKAWQSLPELTHCVYLVEAAEFDALSGQQWGLTPQRATRSQVLAAQHSCDHLLVL
jgi:sulfur relay (sulfurtransferase) DsrF/TusC family protein